MTVETIVFISVMGDLNRDGSLTNVDVAMGRSGFLGKTNLDEMQLIAVDTNKDGKLTNVDVARLRATFLEKTVLNW